MAKKLIKVNSQRMLSLSNELNLIVDKLCHNEYEYDSVAEYYHSEAVGCYPCFVLFYDNLSPLNYPNLSADSEYSLVNVKNLVDDYKGITFCAEIIKCKELELFGKKLLAFIKEAAPDIKIGLSLSEERWNKALKEQNIMYCKHCGEEIADDSRFCKHCGKALENAPKSLTSKPVWIIYFIWALANLYLLMGEKYEECASYFFPFTSTDHFYNDYCSWEKDFYDFSEFIIYVFIIPAILYIVYRRNTNKINNFIDKLLNKKNLIEH